MMPGQQRAVLQVILTRDYAGTERHVAELACALRAHGWRSVIAARADASPVALRRYREVADVRVLPRVPALALAPYVARLASRTRAHLLHAHLGNATAAAVGAGMLRPCPVVSTAHFVVARHEQRRTSALRRPLHRAMLSRTAAVIAISDAVATRLRSQPGTRPPVHLVHNGIGCIDGTGSREVEPQAGTVLYIGRLSAEKQVGLLIRAIGQSRANARLVVAGRGDAAPSLRRLAETMHLPVRFLGFVEDVRPHIREACAVIIPSVAEPFGLVALEAMREARPVIGFSAGALPEIVVDGVTGRLVEAADVGALASAIDRLLGDAASAQRMGQQGRRRYLDRFTAARMAAETASVYEAVLGTRPRYA